jgi:hypothetical protein
VGITQSPYIPFAHVAIPCRQVPHAIVGPFAQELVPAEPAVALPDAPAVALPPAPAFAPPAPPLPALEAPPIDVPP